MRQQEALTGAIKRPFALPALSPSHRINKITSNCLNAVKSITEFPYYETHHGWLGGLEAIGVTLYN